jgi:hypothetical protein
VRDHPSATQILRDDIMAQLRAAGRPMTTTELRKNAPTVPTRGATRLLAPLQEQIYRVLRGLVHDGLVTRTARGGRTVTWTTTPGQADHEIAALEAALSISIDQPRPNAVPTDPVAIAAAHLKAAARTANQAARTTCDYKAVGTALSHVVTWWADVLAAVAAPASVTNYTQLIQAAIRSARTLVAADSRPRTKDTP